MDQRTAIETDLTQARASLDILKKELPNYHALLTDNEQDVQRLKNDRAPLDAQAQAKGRVGVAREMLEQHQSDIATAQAEVDRLEALKHRESLLEKMHTAAESAKAHREAMN